MSMQVRKALFDLVNNIKIEYQDVSASTVLPALIKKIQGVKLSDLEQAILADRTVGKKEGYRGQYLNQIFLSAGWVEKGTNKPFVDQDLLIQVLNALPNETSRTLFMHAYEEELAHQNDTYLYKQGLSDSTGRDSVGYDRSQALDSYAKQFNLEDLGYAEPK